MDFRLKVFYTVAQRLSFTKAAAELFITQPAVSKHIQELEEHHKIKLFERNGSRIAITAAGNVLLKHVKNIFDIYSEIDFDMNALLQTQSGVLRVGASTTVSQYIIPPVLAQFHQKLQDVQVRLWNGNTEQMETALLQQEIEIGIVEGKSKNKQIKYIPFLKDELVLVCNSKNPLTKCDTIGIDDLKQMSFLLREQGSGTLEVIDDALKALGVKLSDLQVEMQLGSTESIKSYLMNSNCVAFISIHAIQKELQNKELYLLDLDHFAIERFFYIITLQGKTHSLADVLAQKILSYYNLKL
jgi:DNA-binding transcriptional LysR family regulator